MLYESVPEFAAEYDDVKVLALWTTDVGVLHTVNQPVETLENLRGLKIRSPGPITNNLLEALGTTPVSMPINEVYDSLERGVVDGLVTPYSAITSFGLNEVLGHSTQVPIYVSTLFLVMNKQTWQDLSSDDQEVVNQMAGEELSLQGARAYEEEREAGIEKLEESGVEIHELSEAEFASWREAGERVISEWIEEREAQGIPGRKVYETILETTSQG